jgi:hypothetical protein
MDWLDLDTLKSVLGDVLSTEIAKFGIGFTIAAWLHAGRMKKEIRSQFSSLTSAIENLGLALRQDLKSQSERLEKAEGKVNQLVDRVDALEKH